MSTNEHYLRPEKLEAIAKMVMSPTISQADDWHGIAELLIQHIAVVPSEIARLTTTREAAEAAKQ